MLLIKHTTIKCMDHAECRPSLYLRQDSVVAAEFERWKLTVTAAERIAKCDSYTPVSAYEG